MPSTECYGLGLIATRDLDPTDTLLFVPSSISLVYTTSLDDTSSSSDEEHQNNNKILKYFFRDRGRSWLETTTTPTWYVRLALQLLYWKYNFGDEIHSEITTSTTTESSSSMKHYRGPWMECLPTIESFTKTHPQNWCSISTPNDNVVLQELLQYSPIVNAIEKDVQQWKDQYHNLITNPYLAKQSKESLCWSDFIWACQCVLSRAFSARINITAEATTTKTKPSPPPSSSSSSASSAIVLASNVPAKKARTFVICPCIDMVNHSTKRPSAQVRIVYDNDSDNKNNRGQSTNSKRQIRGYSLEATQKITKGSEVFISYGEKSNDDFLRLYGFVETNNPHDSYTLHTPRIDDDDEDDTTKKKYHPSIVLSRSDVRNGIQPLLRKFTTTFKQEHNAKDSDPVAAAANDALELELASMPTTLQDDLILLEQQRLPLQKPITTTVVAHDGKNNHESNINTKNKENKSCNNTKNEDDLGKSGKNACRTIVKSSSSTRNMENGKRNRKRATANCKQKEEEHDKRIMTTTAVLFRIEKKKFLNEIIHIINPKTN